MSLPAELVPIVNELERGPAILRDAARRLPESSWRAAPQSGSFCLVEHAWHMADLEREGFGVRLQRLLDEEEPLLPDFDGDTAARERDYTSRPLASAIEAFAGARARNLALLRAVAPSGVEGHTRARRANYSSRCARDDAEARPNACRRDRGLATGGLMPLLWVALAVALPGTEVLDEALIRAATRDFVEAFNTGDVERALHFYADEYVDLNLREPHQSKAARRRYLSEILHRADATVDVAPEEILVRGDHAFVRGTIHLRRASSMSELRYMEVLRRFPQGWKAIWGIDAQIYDASRE
jgi:ketosteroid isomerase-like protein